MSAPIVGIDLGTSSCSVACMVDGQPQVLPVFNGHEEMPTHVAFTSSGERLIGWPAKRQVIANPANTIFTIKRLIGRKFASEATQAELGLLPYRVIPSASGRLWVEAGGRTYSPVEIIAMMLAEVRRATSAYFGHPVTQAVVTVPAYFDEEQRRATTDAASIAGLEVLQLVAEPTAAAIAHGLGRPGQSGFVAVYDLGGGTFDISILEIGDGVFEVKSVSGDTRLGGEDFDHRLVSHFISQIKRDDGWNLSDDALALHRLKDASEQLKIQLDAVRQAELTLPYLAMRNGQPFHATLSLSRSTLEALVDDMIERTLEPCRKALKDAGLAKGELDALVLCGGMSRMPCVRKKISEFFGLTPKRHHDASRIVALGAAIQAGVIKGEVKDVILFDVVPMSLGICGPGGVFTRLIDRNTPMPTRKSQAFRTGEDDLMVEALIKSRKLEVFQGDREMAKDNLLLGEIATEFSAPPPNDATVIEVTFDVDANGTLNVSVRNKSGVEYSGRIAYRLDDSLTHRPLDDSGLTITEDSLAAARAQADKMLSFLANTLRTHGQNIRSDILRRIEEVREQLQRAMQSRDGTELTGALAAFCEATNMKPPATEAAPRISSPAVAVKATTSSRSVFISYARKDNVWLDRLRTHLVPLERSGKVEIWHDGKIESGALWQSEIEAALANASVAILLVSANFMASAFIYDHELPPILERNRAHGLGVLPVFIGHCYYQRDPVLSRFNAFNDPKLPVSAMADAEAEAHLARLAGELWERLNPA